MTRTTKTYEATYQNPQGGQITWGHEEIKSAAQYDQLWSKLQLRAQSHGLILMALEVK